MTFPGMSDNYDQMVQLLAQIAENTGDIETQETQDVTIEGSNIDQRIGVVPHNTIVITESGDLDSADDDGTITLERGQETTIAEFTDQAHAVYAVGATDVQDVRYWLEIDGDPAVGPTRGPLGTVNSPFSFVEKYGGAVPADNRCRLRALYTGDSGEVNVVGRIHLEVM